MTQQRFDVVCGLAGPFHVVDHFYHGEYEVIGKGIASFSRWRDADELAARLNAENQREREPGEEG